MGKVEPFMCLGLEVGVCLVTKFKVQTLKIKRQNRFAKNGRYSALLKSYSKNVLSQSEKDVFNGVFK